MSKKIANQHLNNKQAELFKACIAGTPAKTIVCKGGYKRIKKENK